MREKIENAWDFVVLLFQFVGIALTGIRTELRSRFSLASNETKTPQASVQRLKDWIIWQGMAAWALWMVEMTLWVRSANTWWALASFISLLLCGLIIALPMVNDVRTCHKYVYDPTCDMGQFMDEWLFRGGMQVFMLALTYGLIVLTR